ncbi:MAG: hypothetical protein Q9217_006771 [Psora testacea]
MLCLSPFAFAASVATVSAQVSQGFNYGSTYSEGGAPITQAGYEAQFNAAKNLVGTSGFTSARIYTLIQAGTTNTPSEAIQAAINTKTSLLLGLWASAGQVNINNELAALSAAITAYGTAFTDLIVGISVGSEDLYRISPIGIENKSGIGAGPEEVANYIGQVKSAIANTAAAGKPVGHVDTWTAWVNSSNDAVIAASDFIGMDAYPYFQSTMTNPITNGYSLFFSAYDQTVAAVGGKPVWVTETGWPVSGPTENLAVPSTQNALTYWDQVGCRGLFGKINTWWYTLQDAFPTTPSPSFGVVGAGSSGTDVPTTPLYDLSCSDASSDVPLSASVAPSSANPGPSAVAGGNNGAQRQNQVEQSGAASGGVTSGSAASAEAQIPANPDASVSGSATPAEVLASTGFGITPTEQPTTQDTVIITSCPSDCKNTAAQALPNAQPTTLITKTSVLSAASAGASVCPASLSGQYEYPHLIVPLSKDDPDTAQGTSYNGTISPSTSSVFNFDIPASDSGKTCTLVFLLPLQNKLTTSAFSLSGSGGFDIAQLKSPATEQTTYNSVPETGNQLGGPSSVTPGNEYVIASGSCAAGSRIGYKVSATGSLDLNYFQNYSPSPIGFYVTVC